MAAMLGKLPMPTIAAHEAQGRSWALNAIFGSLHYPALVDDRAEVSDHYVRGKLIRTGVNGVESISFAMP